jgi:predicted RNase H-like HicB family nuclease
VGPDLRRDDDEYEAAPEIWALGRTMKDADRYAKIVEWSEEDQCYVGSAGVAASDCHGDDEREVFAELLDIVDEVIALYHVDKRPLPPAAAGRFTASAAE